MNFRLTSPGYFMEKMSLTNGTPCTRKSMVTKGIAKCVAKKWKGK